MKRKLLTLLMMVMCIFIICSCGDEETPPESTPNPGSSQSTESSAITGESDLPGSTDTDGSSGSSDISSESQDSSSGSQDSSTTDSTGGTSDSSNKKETVTITFVLCGGELVSGELTVEVEKGGKLSAIKTPEVEKDGYIFFCWSYDEEGDFYWEAGDKFYVNTELYAIYEKDDNDASESENSGTSGSSDKSEGNESADSSSTVESTDTPGSNDNNEGNESADSSSTVESTDTPGSTDSSKEEVKVTVIFNPMGGNVISGQVEVLVKRGSKLTATDVPVVEMDGYTFLYWAIDEEGEYEWSISDRILRDTELYAIWEADEGTSSSSTGGSSSTGSSSSTTDSSTSGSTVDSSTPSSYPGATDSSIYYPPDPDIPDEPTFPVGYVAPVIQYVRIAQIGASNVTIKFNATGRNLAYEIRYSTSPITAENFASATLLENVTVSGAGEVKTAIIDLTVGKTTKYYIAVQATSNGEKSSVESVRAGGIDLVYVDPNRITSIYCGEVIKDLTPLIDESEGIIDPLNGNPGLLPSNQLDKFYWMKGEIRPGMLDPYTETHERYGTDLAPIIDLEYTYYIECIMVYYRQDTYDLDVRSSKDFAGFDKPNEWDGTNKSYLAATFKANDWNEIPIGKEVRFIQLQFLDGEAPTEVVIYGYQIGETVGDELGSTQHKLPTIGEMMGVCGLLGDGGGYCTVEQLSCATVLREYHNLGWSYNWSSFPMKSTTLTRTNLGNFDKKYKDHYMYNLIVPCLQWSDGDNPARTYNKLTGKLNAEVATFTEKYLPSTYIAYADVMYQYAARYGSSKMGYLAENIRAHSDGGSEYGLNYIKWLEYGNEPNGEDQRGTTPYQLAALTSAAYDGHMRTVLADVYNPDDFTYFLGAKNADPDIKVAMAGLAGIGDKYITAMCYWLRAERSDIRGNWTSKNDTIAMDAFNVHTYFGELYYLNNEPVYVGVCPEEYGLVDAMSDLIEFRNKYYPGVEIWLTEFGWDTNESYETMTSSHSYGIYSSRQVQAMWLTRAYLLLSSCGVDKATMYMLEDLGNDRKTSGKYGTCGIYGYTFDAQGRVVYESHSTGEDCFLGEDGKYYYDDGVLVQGNVSVKLSPKEGYYYMSTLLNTLYDFTFKRELKSGNDDVWVYQYANADKDEAYALWCPTANMTRVDGYKLYVGTEYESVILTETDAEPSPITGMVENGSQTGKQTKLTVDEYGYVTVNVSENPVYVVVNK